MTTSTKQLIIASVAIAIIAASAVWIYRKSFAPPAFEPAVQVQTVVGEVLAEETIKLIGNSGQIVVITLEEGQSHELDTQYESFKDGLKKSSIKILRTETISAGKSKYGPGSGMSGRRFVKTVTQYAKVDAIISLVGLPDADEEELKELKGQPVPKVVAFERNPKALPDLFASQLLQLAIIPRSQGSSTTPTKPKTPREWFEKQFEIVRAGAGSGNNPGSSER